MIGDEATVRLDLNNPVFQENLHTLQKAERHAAMATLNKIRPLTWIQLDRDQGLKWERISSIKPPPGIDAVYSLRISGARRVTAHRDRAYRIRAHRDRAHRDRAHRDGDHRNGDFIRFLTIATDHDATDGKG